jgi:hypothetical protein
LVREVSGALAPEQTQGLMMQKIEDYCRHAEECRTMARLARSPHEHDMLTNMARTWDDLSTHRAEQIARQARSATIPGGDDRVAVSIPVDRPNASNDE